jgi:hypothetical protein
VLRLLARTEGWAAGLQLAALRLRDRADPSAFIERFTGPDVEARFHGVPGRPRRPGKQAGQGGEYRPGPPALGLGQDHPEVPLAGDEHPVGALGPSAAMSRPVSPEGPWEVGHRRAAFTRRDHVTRCPSPVIVKVSQDKSPDLRIDSFHPMSQA